MKLKDLPEYCKSHYCIKSYGNWKTKCEYQNVCSFYCDLSTSITWIRLLNDLEKDITKDD